MRVNTRGPSGRTVTRTTPTGGYQGGAIIILKSGTDGWCGQALQDYNAGDTAVLLIGHEAEIPKVTGSGKTFALGDKVYRDASTGKATNATTGNTYIGRATLAAGATDDTVRVLFAMT